MTPSSSNPLATSNSVDVQAVLPTHTMFSGLGYVFPVLLCSNSFHVALIFLCTHPQSENSKQWLISYNQTSRERPLERCRECGSVYKFEYVGPPDDPHGMLESFRFGFSFIPPRSIPILLHLYFLHSTSNSNENPLSFIIAQPLGLER